MAKKILIKNGTIVTLGAENRVLEGHCLLIEGDKIKKIAPKKEFKGSYDKTIDAKGKVVLPGFINTHMHFYSTLVRGLGKAAPSKDFNEVLKNLWWRLDKKLTLDDTYYSALLPMVDAIKRGTTTLIDHHASPGAVGGSLQKIAKAAKKTGLRVSLCYELSDRDGKKVAEEGIAENKEFIEFCNKKKDPFLKAMFGLHASFTITDATLKKAAKIGNDLGAGFHCHCAEAKSDQDFNVKNFGMRVIERLEKFGCLGPKSLAIHCVHINDREMAILKKTDTPVVTNPQSNANNAVGVAPLLAMAEKGLLVGLGTDAMTVNMLEELRFVMFLQHLANDNPSCGFMETLSTLAFNNAKIANRHFDCGLGELREGYAADVILMDYHPPTPFDAGTFLGHLGFGLTQTFVDTTIVGGKVLMEKKKLLIDVDEAEANAKARALAQKLWDRF